MKLHVQEWGTGNRIALLIHGLFADHQSWWRVGPALAEQGYRVLVPDLRGHGQSDRGEYTPDHWAADLVETLPTQADLAIGHSLAGMALALAAPQLEIQRAIYVDPAWKMTAVQHLSFAATWRGQVDWTTDQWLQANPRWAAGDVVARVSSMKLFDPTCIEGLAPGDGHDHMPRSIKFPSLVLIADPSPFVTEEDQKALEACGMDAWKLKGTSHSMFREDFDLFMESIHRWDRQTSSSQLSQS
jgi:pimeloyl-ACP methyl ester carboxylesterase